MKIKAFAIVILTLIPILSIPKTSYAAYYDIPSEHWAYSFITQATERGIIKGMEDGSFGLGLNVKRSEFAAMLNRLMGWEKADAADSSFSDVSVDSWYFGDIETIRLHNAADGDIFRPEENITRSEMAVMLVKALGYDSLASQIQTLPFEDVNENKGYISIAYDFGIINGKDNSHFDPNGFALREECAAMMMRLYEKYNQNIDWLHGFYAISSWRQRDMAAYMDNISFGWSRLEFDDENGVWLNTSSENNNDWRIPDGHTDAVDYFKSKNIGFNLAVLMNTSQGFNSESTEFKNTCEAVLLSQQNRASAISYIVNAASEYSGITIDFEGMAGQALKAGLNAFLEELKASTDKPVYIMVHPVMDGEYYDAYDYKTLGNLCDRVILMAHDYAALTMSEDMMNAGFTTTPVTPFYSVYKALKAISDPIYGVEDKNKIALAVSLSSTAAWITENGQVINSEAIHPSMDTIINRLKQSDTVISYSDAYRNPYANYKDDNGQNVTLWYEDSRSITDKIQLARMFGINGLSIWRIGAIPNEKDSGIYYDIWDAVLNERFTPPLRSVSL